MYIIYSEITRDLGASIVSVIFYKTYKISFLHTTKIELINCYGGTTFWYTLCKSALKAYFFV